MHSPLNVKRVFHTHWWGPRAIIVSFLVRGNSYAQCRQNNLETQVAVATGGNTKQIFQYKDPQNKQVDSLSLFLFHIHVMHLDIIKVIHSPMNAQILVIKNNIKIYIKIVPTCFRAVTPFSGSSLFVLAKVTLC